MRTSECERTGSPNGDPLRAGLRRVLGLLVLGGALLVATGLNADTLTLNLKDASIRTLVETIAEITGENFIIDPRVKGKVTVVSSRPMDRKEIYQVFLSILQVHGFAAVDTGGVIKILPDVNAKQSSVPTVSEDAPGVRDEMVTRVVPVNNVAAIQLVPILRPLVPQQGHLAAYAPTNVLIISDRAANISRLVEIIERIDLASQDEVEVITLRHAAAAEVVRILTSLSSPPAQGEAAISKLNMIADERTNSILLGGPPERRLRIRTIITHLDTPLQTGGNTEVVYLRYAKAKELVTVLTGLSGDIVAEGKDRDRIDGSVSIQADEAANALVMSAPPDIMRTFSNVIRKLDVRRAQVLVEAVIAEMSVDKSAELGVQYRLGSVDGGSGPFAVQDFGGVTSGQGINSLSLNPLAIGSGLALGVVDGVISFGDTTILNIQALVRALRSDVSTNILSTPSVLTLDNQEAEIVVGQNVPFVTGQFTSTGSGDGVTNPFQTIERRDVGLTLKVKPQINEGNAVLLEIDQEISQLIPTVADASDLITTIRSVKTGVLVDDGEIVVLGGLIDDNHTESVQKVPLLGDLPVLGRLFRFNRTDKDKRNLMIFIRPVIMRGGGTEAVVSSEKYNFMRAQQLAEREKGVSLMRGEETAVLPELSKLLGPPPAPGDKRALDVP